MFRWTRRRSRALAGLVGAEIALFSTVLYVSVNDKLYGGLTPYAADVAHRASRDPSVEPRCGARPCCCWTVAGAWLAAVALAPRGGLRRVLDSQVDVEVAAAFLIAICAVGALVSRAAPAVRRGPGGLEPAALPRIGAGLIALTLAATAYTLVS